MYCTFHVEVLTLGRGKEISWSAMDPSTGFVAAAKTLTEMLQRVQPHYEHIEEVLKERDDGSTVHVGFVPPRYGIPAPGQTGSVRPPGSLPMPAVDLDDQS